MHSRFTSHKQNGAVLLVSLIILLIMTVIGTSGITSVTLEERMVSNMYDDNLSFQASETGLRDCEDYIADLSRYITDQQSQTGSDVYISGADEPGEGAEVLPPLPSPSSVWSGSEGLNFWWQDPEFWKSNGTEYGATDGDAVPKNLGALAHGAVATNPRCIREEVAFYADDKEKTKLKKIGWFQYQNTTAATGADARTMSVVQSAYFKRYK